jgi:sulfoxide reductase heme-binding subunit YedZ
VTEALWYLGRGSGLMALLLLSVATALGIATSTGRVLPGLPRFAVTALHRNASLTAVVFLIVHIGTLLFDPYAQLRVADIVVPFTGEYRPFWLGLGTLGFDLLLAVVVTSLLRHRIGLRTWRAVHWSAYAAWPMGLVHSIGTGTDSAQAWYWVIAVLSVITVGAAFVWRLVPTGVRP